VRPRTLLATGLAVTTTAVVGGLASRPAQSSWYRRLRKPPYQPPRQVFPVVWPVLYADIAAVAASALDDLATPDRERRRRAYIGALSANLVLNAGWSWLFFDRRRLGLSAAAAGVLAVSSADLTRRSVAASGAKAAPVAAYAAWTAFATVLSTHIWMLNRG